MTRSSTSTDGWACFKYAQLSPPPTGSPPETDSSPQTKFRSRSARSWITAMLAGVAMFGLAAFGQTQPASAQNAVFDSGNTIVTGFSGIKEQPDAPSPTGNQLDKFFIDPDGISVKVFKVDTPEKQEGQLLDAPTGFTIPANKVGQVFAVALDESPDGETPPNIYLGATSVFGLNILVPDAEGHLQRSTTGAPNAEWMDGQFGPASENAGPGTIYKVDSATGEVSIFATLPDNSGPGVGDIVYDKTTQQFFASDLDTGLIHRIDASGTVLDSYDHGTMGLPAAGQAPIADDGSAIDASSPAFDTTNPATWGFTQRERMVWGLAMHGGRLYYAVQGGPEIWSVGINLDGTFANDPREELKVEGLAGDTYISDMLFDAQGQLYLAQRGEFRGSYDYSVFAEPQRSDVLRYRQEMPDDPATPGIWAPVPESYAIGFPEGYKNASGGIALGRCNANMLWTTGDNLRNNPAYEEQLNAGGPLEVHGLQGNNIDLVRPQNEPPFQSVFVDYDGQFGDPEKAGHIGDVEIWQPCKGQEQGYDEGYYIPPYVDVPEDIPPPPFESFNLRLRKHAWPHDCWRGGQGWICRYTIRVTNTGPDSYLGPVTVHDHIPGLPGGSIVDFTHQPPWNCTDLGGNNFRCVHPPVFLLPGDSIDLHVRVDMPAQPVICRLTNIASIDWPHGWGDADPTDDSDAASANVPAEECDPHGERTNLKIEKHNLGNCYPFNDAMRCQYSIVVTNEGPGQYTDPIVVTDTIPAGTTAHFSGGGWDPCVGGPPTYTCTHPPVAGGMGIGDTVVLFAAVDVPLPVAREMQCQIPNQTHIAEAPGGTPQNTNPGDDDASATANVPPEICQEQPQQHTNLQLRKDVAGHGCQREGNVSTCRYRIVVTNTGPGPYNGQLRVRDTIPTGATANFSAPWTCVDVGGTIHDCTRDVNLPLPGTAVSLDVEVQVPDNIGMHLQCDVTNQARITIAPGGSPQNTNAGDDTDDATAHIPELCAPPPPVNLRIEKRAGTCTQQDTGWRCLYYITVQNTGPGTYVGEIRVSDTLSASPASSSWNAPWSCSGGSTKTCTHPTTVIPPMGTRQLQLAVTYANDVVREHECHLPNQVQITQAPGGTPLNTNPGDDTASATATAPAWFCTNLISNPPLPACPPGFRAKGGGSDECVQNLCPPHQYLSRGHCCPRGRYWDGRHCARRKPPECPEGTHGKYPRCIPDEPVLCPPHWTGKPPVCCPPGRPYRDGKCMPRLCPPGTHGKFPLCCERGEHLSRGHCCERGTVWNGRTCARECRRGEYLTHGQCCKIGTVWRHGQCVPNMQECPKGTHGKYPRCIPDETDRVCPKGTHGKYPRCISDETDRVCPKGTHGKYPRCIKDRPQPRVCPPGTHGRPPRCIKNRRPEPRVCPPGTHGRPPRCVPNRRPQPHACPPGTHGRPPRCISNRRPHPVRPFRRPQRERLY